MENRIKSREGASCLNQRLLCACLTPPAGETASGTVQSKGGEQRRTGTGTGTGTSRSLLSNQHTQNEGTGCPDQAIPSSGGRLSDLDGLVVASAKSNCHYHPPSTSTSHYTFNPFLALVHPLLHSVSVWAVHPLNMNIRVLHLPPPPSLRRSPTDLHPPPPPHSFDSHLVS